MMRKTIFTACLLATTVLHRPAAKGQDPGDFVAMLNQARAARGLAPVAYDPGLAAGASDNNAWQCARGMGHWAMSGAGQCAAQAFDAATALGMWAASPSHAGILFDPAARSCGFACGGGFATANVSSGGAAAIQPPDWPYPVPLAIYSYPAPMTWGYAAPVGAPCYPAMPRRRGLFGRWWW